MHCICFASYSCHTLLHASELLFYRRLPFDMATLSASQMQSTLKGLYSQAFTLVDIFDTTTAESIIFDFHYIEKKWPDLSGSCQL